MTDAIMGDGPRPNWSYLNAAPFFWDWFITHLLHVHEVDDDG